MTPRTSLVFAVLFASSTSAVFVWFVRMPLPFEGFSIIAAGVLSCLGTLSVLTLLPAKWVWSEAELLRYAFQSQHGVSVYAAGSALDAIANAHSRATKLRALADTMRKDVAERTCNIADRLDAAALEIFYNPERHRDLRAVLIRSDLIEEAAISHVRLLRHKQAETENTSRTKFLLALDALEDAFDETELIAAKGLLAEVTVASDVAEALLKPRKALHEKQETRRLDYE